MTRTIDEARQHRFAATDNFARPSGTWAPQGLTGFSLHFALDGESARSADHPHGRLVVETLVRERMLYIQMKNLFRPGEGTFTADDHRVIPSDVEDRGVAGPFVTQYSAQLADGRPLPSWLGSGGKGLVMGERPADVDRIELRVKAVFSDGTEVTRFVTVDTNSGEIQPLLQKRSEIDRPALFSQQFAANSDPQQPDTDLLAAALAR